MEWRKYAAAGMAALLTAAFVAGCGADKQTDKGATAQKGKIVIGLDDNFPPFGFHDESGELVGTQQGSTGLEAIEAEPELRDSFKELKQYSDNVTSFMDLEVGRIDAVVVAQTTAAYFIKKNNAPFRIIDVGYPDIPSGVGMRKDDTELKARIDKVLEDMHNDGTSKKISEKWFGIDVTM